MAKQREKRGLRPVQDVVGRLRFDAVFDVRRFVVGYEERFAGVREAPLADFLAGDNEIPWHRIFFIKAGALVVWDRRERIDLVFGSGDSPAPDHPAIAAACAPAPVVVEPPKRRGKPQATGPASFVAQPCFRFDPLRGVWIGEPVSALAEARVEALNVATYNILYDLHDAEHIYSERRVPVCLELLRQRDADIIALQEVTPEFWNLLLAEPWVRAGYYVSEGPGADSLDPYGQALLSRWPLALELHAFSTRKRLVIGRLALAGRRLAIAAVHLTSNRHTDAPARRAEQLAVLTERLGQPDVDDALVLGDLNFGDGDEDEAVARAGYTDAWRLVHPHHPGFTFDPVANPLATLASRTGRAARFDRVLLRSPAGALAPIDITMFGDRPFETGPEGQALFASDHFGLCALLQVVQDAQAAAARAHLATLAPVHRSALVVIPPAHVWPSIQAIRAEHDPSHARWMPHINLVYGFVPDEEFPAAAAALQVALRGLLPLRLTLSEVRRFDHRGSTTVWLAPASDPPGALEAVQAAAAALFPRCDEQSARGAFVPHLTIAKLDGDEPEIVAAIARWQASLRPLSFTVDQVHLISRRDDQPFAIRHSLPTTSPSEQVPEDMCVEPLPPWAALPSPVHAHAVAAFGRACAAAIGAGGRLHVVGSARLGVAQPDGDLDLVWSGPDDLDRELLFAAVTDRLADEGALTGIRLTRSAGLPVLKCSFEGLAVDLQVAGLPPALHARALAGLGPDELATLDEASRRAALGCVDADALARLVLERLDVLVFRATLARVRRWARARQLDAGAWGLLGGYTWALVVGWSVRAAIAAGVPAEPDALLRHFFAEFTAREPGLPIAFGPIPPAPGRRAPWPIYTPTPPVFNSARGLTRSTLSLLHREFARADATLRAGDGSLDAPVDPSADPRRLELTLHHAGDSVASAGWLEGQVLGLVLALEHAGAGVRPYPRPRRDPAAVTWTFGLEGGEADRIDFAARRFADQFAVWPERPPGAELVLRIIA